jgi:hypothetical protein
MLLALTPQPAVVLPTSDRTAGLHAGKRAIFVLMQINGWSPWVCAPAGHEQSLSGRVCRSIDGSLRELWMPDLQIAMRDPKIDRIRATRRFGAFAVLSLRAIEKIRAGTASEAARHFEQVARTQRLRETGAYDPRLVDMLIALLRQAGMRFPASPLLGQP